MGANWALGSVSARAQWQDLRTTDNGKMPFTPMQAGFFCTLLSMMLKVFYSPNTTSPSAASSTVQSVLSNSSCQLSGYPGGANSEGTPHAI